MIRKIGVLEIVQRQLILYRRILICKIFSI